MNKSESIKLLAVAMCKAQAEMQKASKISSLCCPTSFINGTVSHIGFDIGRSIIKTNKKITVQKIMFDFICFGIDFLKIL